MLTFIKSIDTLLKHISGFLIVCFFLLGMANAASAKAHQDIKIDLYRTNQITKEDVKKKVGNKLKKLALLMSASLSDANSESSKTVGLLMHEIISDIQSMGDFAYIDISAMLSPNKKKIYFGIDLVDSKDKARIPRLLPNPLEDVPDPDHLIQHWRKYEDTGFDLALKGKMSPNVHVDKCPAQYCVFEFEHVALQKYKNIFNRDVPKNKAQLIAILRKDKDEKKRTAAVYLLAHLKSGEEVIQALLPSLFDHSKTVRGSVLEVIGGTLNRNPSINFKPEQVIFALDWPNENHRNRALQIMINLIDKPAYSDYIKKHANHLLVEHLKLTHSNFHDMAYLLLRKISGEKFADKDIKSWEQWAKSVQ